MYEYKNWNQNRNRKLGIALDRNYNGIKRTISKKFRFFSLLWKRKKHINKFYRFRPVEHEEHSLKIWATRYFSDLIFYLLCYFSIRINYFMCEA